MTFRQVAKGGKLRWLGLPFAGLLAACGGSGGGVTPQADNVSTISGTVFAAAVNGASCQVKDLTGNVITSFITGSSGGYSVNVPDSASAQDLVVACSGGRFSDEATDQAVTAGTLSAYIAAGSGGTAHITPATTIIHSLMTVHGLSYTEALDAFEAAFGYQASINVKPADTRSPGDADDEGKLAGLRAAVFSQLTADLGLQPGEQFALLAALAADLSDGTLDGLDASGAVAIANTVHNLPSDIHNRMARALVNFRGSSQDQTGLDNASIGTVPFAKTAATDNYTVEYAAAKPAVNGMSEFTLKVSDVFGTPQTGLTVSVMPIMHMATKNHSTPYESCAEGTSGEYTCTVYYLMPSAMNGMSMGYWELQAMIGGMGDVAYFYPPVKMAMGDTAQVKMKGVTDMVGAMGQAEQRTYILFKRALSGMGDNRSFEIFVAAQESMMSFPAVYAGQTLNSGDMNYQLAISTMSVEVSSDVGGSWIAATDQGNGRWLTTGLSGLIDGVESELRIRVTVEGEEKMTNGVNYATFRVTPGGMGGM